MSIFCAAFPPTFSPRAQSSAAGNTSGQRSSRGRPIHGVLCCRWRLQAPSWPWQRPHWRGHGVCARTAGQVVAALPRQRWHASHSSVRAQPCYACGGLWSAVQPPHREADTEGAVVQPVRHVRLQLGRQRLVPPRHESSCCSGCWCSCQWPDVKAPSAVALACCQTTARPWLAQRRRWHGGGAVRVAASRPAAGGRLAGIHWRWRPQGLFRSCERGVATVTSVVAAVVAAVAAACASR